METIEKVSKAEQKVAMASYDALASVIEQLRSNNPEIEIEETGEKIKVPLKALKFLGQMLKAMSTGKMISLVPVATEVTTQRAAEMLGCSRPHIVKLLEKGDLDFIKVGKHRRIKFEDVVQYKQKMKAEQKRHIIDIMNFDEESGLYDS
ncbi:helix-turn-helix domain-containing protein [Niabella sp. W65]|nr:helix-turn-helix domain-containing protein [Niabella sp. W65]MCH7369337.1 helix-turn-helix domain-containing protein [Niabella sp. W65]ULT44876.1 helix-turn-helix domain-containing protein [Niabella sp. I65]